MKILWLHVFLLLSTYCVVGQNLITLSFVGKDAVTQNLLSLDSVLIRNLTQVCDTTLYKPVSSLTVDSIWSNGIDELNARNPGGFILSQNYPNPFNGSTQISISKDYDGPLNLVLFDETGEKLAEYQNSFTKGIHSFVISSSGNKVLILVVNDGKVNRSIKIISTGRIHSSSGIQYTGQTQFVGKSTLKNPESSVFAFFLGNQLMYTAYAEGYTEKSIVDSPLRDTGYFFDMSLLGSPIVTTSPITHIFETTATGGGSITTYGGSAITARGVCWSTSANPTLLDRHTTDGSGSGVFASNLTGLSPSRWYYVRAYAKNTDGTSYYGNNISFSTFIIKATNILNVTTTSAKLFYTITATPLPSEHGLFYSTTPNPDTNSPNVKGVYENGRYSAGINTLHAGSVYYVLPYMKVEGKLYFGEIRTIKTLSDYSSFVVDGSVTSVAHKIVWNSPTTAKKISQEGYFGDYGRIKRVGNSNTLILVYHGGPNNGDWLNICLRMSYNNGTTWSDQKIIMNIQDHYTEYWRFCNPEVLVLQNGWVLVAYEANARPDENKSSVQILLSKDTCRTWEEPIKYPTGRTWEPAIVQLPNGEIELFYSSEEKWWPGTNLLQEIRQIYSTDMGYSWSESQLVAYYPEKRDGMPVPLLLQGNKGVAFGIETVNSDTSPFIVKRNLAGPWVLTTSNFLSSPYRWVVSNFSGHGGAPYLLQLPTGEVLLSAHIYRGGDWHQNNYMQTMLGDNNAKNFGQLASPWGVLPVNESAVNNSLFLKDIETVVAVSCRMFTDGSGGVYWLEGKIVPLK